MDTHQNYSDSGMLHSFLDGELDGANEEALFRTLADDGELRAEMQDHLAIRKAIQHDAEAFTPPAAATAMVFAALGFTIPPAVSATTGIGTFFGRAGLVLGSALVTTVAILLFQTSTAPEVPVYTLSQRPAAPITLAQLPQLPPPVVVTRVVTAPATQENSLASVPAAVLEESAGNTGHDAAVVNRPFDSRPRSIAGASASESSDAYSIEHLDNAPTMMSPHYWLPSGFGLQMRGISAKSNPAPTIISQSDPVLANFNVGLFYELDAHHAFGIEAGHEAFSQHFYGREDGELIRYEQNPMAYWFSGVYQVTGGTLYEGLRPYVQAQAGGVFQLGPMARLTMGLKITPFERMSFLVGAEGTLMLYKHQDNWFNTQKVGLTYGMFYQF